MTLYEAIGVCIVGIVSDAGGGNESFMSKIVDHYNLEVKVLNSFTVSFQHPFDSNRRIFVWSCSTHSLKAASNNLYRSQENKTRQLKLHGVYFGWKEVVEIYNREQERYNKTQLRQSDISQNTIALDSFTMMNATYAKQLFTSKTICEAVSHLSKMLGVKISRSDSCESEWEQFMSFLYQLKQKKGTCLYNKYSRQISLLEYQIAVHGIFIERLLNHRWALSRDNIAKEEIILTTILGFFWSWKIEILHSNVDINKSRHWIAKKNV